MMLRVQWTPVGLRSLRMMQEHLAVTWDDKVTDRFLSAIDGTLGRIRQFPGIAAPVEGTSFRRYVLHKHVSLFYTVETEWIKVLLIWDNRMDDKYLFNHLSKSDAY